MNEINYVVTTGPVVRVGCIVAHVGADRGEGLARHMARRALGDTRAIPVSADEEPWGWEVVYEAADLA